MKGLWSGTAGLFIPNHGTGIGKAVSASYDYELQDHIYSHTIALIDDWVDIELDDSKESLRKLDRDFKWRRAVSLCLHLLQATVPHLEEEIFQDLEKSIEQYSLSVDLLHSLAIAPLISEKSPKDLAGRALSSGAVCLASLLNELAQLQPLLRRLTDKWKLLTNDYFIEAGTSQQSIWRCLYEKRCLLELARATDARAFEEAWSTVILREENAKCRLGLNRISRALNPYLETVDKIIIDRIRELKRTEVDLPKQPPPKKTDSTDRHVSTRKKRSEIFEERTRALKEIRAIAAAVADGSDAQASKFLRDLISRQAKGAVEYAVKSLCNLAKQCADMFRPDFERECLDMARKLDPMDVRTRTQWGDHLKRGRNYEEAKAVLSDVVASSGDVVAVTSLADVWAVQGEYSRAIEIYRSVPDWQDRVVIRNALADILRRQGSLEDAQREYDAIVLRWPLEARARTGIADIARRQGNCEEALRIYDDVLKDKGLDYRSIIVYKLSRCHTLKQLERWNAAFREADDIVTKYPFVTEARIQKASLLGLMDRAAEGLSLVHGRERQGMLGEWKRHFIHGLLLLQLERFDEARNQLLDRHQLITARVDDRSIVRMGAVVTYLRDGDIEAAIRDLSGVESTKEYFSDYLSTVLKLHVASHQGDEGQSRGLRQRIYPAFSRNKVFASVVNDLENGEYSRAIEGEVRILHMAVKSKAEWPKAHSEWWSDERVS